MLQDHFARVSTHEREGALFALGGCSQVFNRLNIVEQFAGRKFCSRGWSIPMKSLVQTEELCFRSVPLEHAPGAKPLVCIGLKVFFDWPLLFQNNWAISSTCTLIGREVFEICRPHFSSPANELFYLGDTRERGSKRRSREGRGNSPPSPAFAAPLACLSRVAFSHDIPQMKSLLAGYVFPRYFTRMRLNTQKLSITCIHQGPVVGRPISAYPGSGTHGLLPGLNLTLISFFCVQKHQFSDNFLRCV